MNNAARPVASQPSAEQAIAMLELFASVGATHFDITHTHLTGEPRGFRGNRPLEEVKRSMPPLVASAVRRQNNVIVRPRAKGATLVQLDDLDREKARRVAPASFLVLETSPANYQAWVAVKDAPLGLTTRLRKGTGGADKNASGATRVAGTYNFKEKYAPAFPVVRIAAGKPGHLVSVAELDAMGFLAPEIPPAEIIRPDLAAARAGAAPRKWPSYAECVERAPKNDQGNPKRTSVDFTWCKLATSWGHSIEATAARLMQESTKAQENGEDYALKTAQRAAWAAAQRNRQVLKP